MTRRLARASLILAALLPFEYGALMLWAPNLLASAFIDWASALEGLTPWW
jgi:hypothetical protein